MYLPHLVILEAVHPSSAFLRTSKTTSTQDLGTHGMEAHGHQLGVEANDKQLHAYIYVYVYIYISI